jgi:AcrR family transcriptional regulator
MVSDIRERLIEGGMRVLERDGLRALSVRSLAAEVGTSTMAVYTHFGGMTGVIDALANEAFARFTRALTDTGQTDDPVCDFFVMGAAYRAFALADPQRYQLIFGTTSPASVIGQRTDVTSTGSATDRAEWADSFAALRHAVRRMIASGRIRDDDELSVASRLWSLVHGAVMLELAGFFGHEGHGLTHVLAPLTVDCIVGMGDTRTHTLRSLTAAGEMLGRTG